ncbi:DUF3888 domain-containing protein [Bacillus sp. PS06]|uniref:DUF3888 domain-containing protein n=1 Tax=Bacillus sp. PS06 TaxID=2764176 RepID=UPI00178355BC|nr:DUF3888 domain-containing protein [Bacillus sp. PS06]MBD8070038.1 DUF3888 domain-containing protein [Bacillus sp. PS06]
MRKLVMMSIILLSMCVSSIPISAEKANQHDFEGMEQAFDQFVLSQFTDEMRQAVTDYYKKDSIQVQYNWWNQEHDVVELQQTEKGRELSYPFVIKFTVDTYDENKKGQLGTDTIVFGVSPIQFNDDFDGKNLAASEVELVNYIHREPAKVKDK